MIEVQVGEENVIHVDGIDTDCGQIVHGSSTAVELQDRTIDENGLAGTATLRVDE